MMKRTDRTKYITIAIALISWGIYFAGFQTIATFVSILSIFVLALSPHKNGGAFQIAVFISFITTGLLIDLPLHGIPPALICLPLMGVILNSRTWFFKRMYLYVLLPLEATLINVTAIAFVILGYLQGYTWKQWLPAGIPVFLYALFSVIIYKDRNEARILVSKEKSKQGSTAPDFTLFDQNGNAVSLKELLANNHLLLIFVRGDWCPTCHVMLRGYYKNKEKFAEKNVRIVGIGPDPQGVNKDIMSRIDPNFLMLSDIEQGVAVKYSGALQANNPITKDNYKNGIPLPASFLVHQNGKIIYTSRSDKAAEVLQPDKIFEVLNNMTS